MTRYKVLWSENGSRVRRARKFESAHEARGFIRGLRVTGWAPWIGLRIMDQAGEYQRAEIAAFSKALDEGVEPPLLSGDEATDGGADMAVMTEETLVMERLERGAASLAEYADGEGQGAGTAICAAAGERPSALSRLLEHEARGLALRGAARGSSPPPGLWGPIWTEDVDSGLQGGSTPTSAARMSDPS